MHQYYYLSETVLSMTRQCLDMLRTLAIEFNSFPSGLNLEYSTCCFKVSMAYSEVVLCFGCCCNNRIMHVSYMCIVFLSAPHQPRLDWQMWFAALGHYSSNPWLVNLVHKLLQGENDG